MRIRVKESTKTVSALTDPQPGWMALVDHGACQTPFHSLKRHQQPNHEEEPNMAVAGKGAARKHVVVQITLSKSLFKAEADATAYLEKAGVDGYTLDATDEDVWIAKSNEDNSALKLAKPRATATKTDGVTAFIAEIEGEAEAPTVDEATTEVKAATNVKQVDGVKVVKTAEPPALDIVLRFPDAVKKYDEWGAYMSNEGNLLGVIKDGTNYDGVPPGVDTVVSAVYYTIGNILTGDGTVDKAASLKQLGEDMSTLVLGIYELYDNAEKQSKNADPAIAAAATAFVASFKASLEKAIAGASWVDPTDNVIEPEPEAKVDEPAPVVAAPAGIMDAIKSFGDSLLASVKADLGAISSRIEAVETATTETKAALSRSPTKKSFTEAVLETVDPTVEEKKSADKVTRYNEVAGIMGAPRGRSGA